MVKVAQLAADLPEVRELDLNPLLADENGVVAVDARVAVAPVGPTGAWAARASALRHPALPEGMGTARFRCATVRIFWCGPSGPRTRRCMRHFSPEVTQEDLRLRFFAPVKNLSHAFVARFTQIDYARAMAFVAIEQASGAMLGVVRLHSDANYETGEYAILVRSDLKGRGLGWLLMQLIIEYARAEGLKRIEGQVLSENRTMLEMCRELGFDVAADPEDRETCRVTLVL